VKTVLSLFIFAVTATVAQAATLLPDRATLDLLLGESARTETFGRFNLNDQPVLFLPNCLDSSTLVSANFLIPAQGPDLVIDGVTFCGSGMQIDGSIFDGNYSLWLVNSPLSISFAQPITAFGFSFTPLVLSGTDVTVKLFGADGVTPVHRETNHVDFPGTFIGYAEPAGIGRVEISSVAGGPPNYVLDFMIDDLTFGEAVFDSDNDGVPNDVDQCPDTIAGAVVDAHGCSIDQLVPCEGSRSNGKWKNHGAYVSEFVKTAEAFRRADRISAQESARMVKAAVQSDCGKK